MSAPLAGIKVVEIASFVAVPACGALLADLGAEVIKVEVPWGEIYRHASPRLAGYDSDFPLSAAFNMDNRGKRSLTLDLVLPQAQEALAKVIETADVVLTNGILHFFQVIPVAEHPVKSASLFVQPVGITRVSHINLRSANIEKRIVDDFGSEAHPPLKIEIRIHYCDFLSHLHFDFRSRAPIRFKVSQNSGWLQEFSVHLPGSGTVSQSHDSIMGIGGILEEDRLTRNVVE